MKQRRLSQTRISIAIASFAVLALVALAAVVLVSRDGDNVTSGQTTISLAVTGVPEYIVLNAAPTAVTIEYENKGDKASGPLRLSANLPPNFEALETSPAASGSRSVLEWDVAALKPGEKGSVAATLRGTPPENKGGARYDYQGYEGYTAFDDGFSMTVRIAPREGGVALAEASAKAATGSAGPYLTVSPNTATRNVGQTHTVFAVHTPPLGGVPVHFTVISGPHIGQQLQTTTNGSGQASFTYTGTAPGTDIIRVGAGAQAGTAGQVCPGGTFCDVSAIWLAVQPAATPTTPAGAAPAATATVTPTPTPTAILTAPPVLGPGLAGALGGAGTNPVLLTATAVARAAQAPAVAPVAPAVGPIQPPSTGDAGVERDGNGAILPLLVASVLVLGLVVEVTRRRRA